MNRTRVVLFVSGSWIVVVVWLMLSSTTAIAGIFTDGTRVIFRDGYAEQSLRLSNQNTYPILVQAWVDDGRADRTPEQADSPIFTMPPIFRMAPQEQFSLRLVYSGEPLPQDRESVFWLNLYEIPPTPNQSSELSTSLIVTMRTQMKVFYRPEKLSLSVGKLIEKLTFSVKKNGNHARLIIENPTPYFATISSLQITQGDNAQQKTIDMIAPFDKAIVELDILSGSDNNNVSIDVGIVNDSGNIIVGNRSVLVVTE